MLPSQGRPDTTSPLLQSLGVLWEWHSPQGQWHSVPRDSRAQLCPYGSCPTMCWDTALLPSRRAEDRRVQDQVAQCQQTPQITVITIRIFNKSSMQSSKLCPDLHDAGRLLFSPALPALLLENKRCKVQWCMKEKQNPVPAAAPPLSHQTDGSSCPRTPVAHCCQ